jgi:DNA-binding transcriptional LysR family regulator
MPLRFTLRQLEYFVAVGETGSIAVAAENVNVSSPSISAAIGQLEAELGLQLFVRQHARGLALTQAGRQMMDQAITILDAARALTRLASDISGKVRGPLALGCLLTFAQLIVPQLRRSFEDRYPDVRVSQFELHQQEIFDRLRTGRIDVALTYDLEIAGDLRFVPLVELPPHVVVAETHALAGLETVSVADLEGHPMVLLDLPLSRDYLLSFFRHARYRPRVAERTRDIEVMRGLVGNGFGYAIANIRPMNDSAPDGTRLRYIPLAGKVRPMTLGLALVAGAENVLTVRSFIDHCRALAAAEALPGLVMHRRPTPRAP